MAFTRTGYKAGVEGTHLPIEIPLKDTGLMQCFSRNRHFLCDRRRRPWIVLAVILQMFVLVFYTAHRSVQNQMIISERGLEEFARTQGELKSSVHFSGMNVDYTDLFPFEQRKRSCSVAIDLERMKSKLNCRNDPDRRTKRKDVEEPYSEHESENILCQTPPNFLDNYKTPCFYENGEDGELRCLPYFHLIGVCKSATTDLHRRLNQHPEISSGKGRKEIQFWNQMRFGFCHRKPKDLVSLDEYMDMFVTKEIIDTVEDRNGEQYHPVALGDYTPATYWEFNFWKYMPENLDCYEEPRFTHVHHLRHLQPDLKIMLILREPTNRQYSDYKMRTREPSREDFHDAVVEAITIIESCTSTKSLRICIFSNEKLYLTLRAKIYIGLYGLYITEWLAVFPREQMFILRTEDYGADIEGHMKQIYEYLELRPLSDKEIDKIASRDRSKLASEDIGPMFVKTKKLLDNFYQETKEELARILKDDKFLWKDV